MKTIKRCVKYDDKFEDYSDISSDKQGTYYQFLVERKVPNGTLRHIASLINVTYEFIPDNCSSKRQKVKEQEDPCSSSFQDKKENLRYFANMNDNLISEELNALQNMELKMLEDKPKRRVAKNSEKITKSKAFFQSLPFRGSDWRTKEETDVITICKKSSKTYKHSKSTTIELDHQLPFLRNQKLIPWNLKMGNHKKEKWSNPRCHEKAKYFITYVNKAERQDIASKTGLKELPMKKSKSMACKVKEDSLNLGIKRNSKVKYVKADVFRKHEKIRDQLFEEKISELVHRTENRQEEKTTSFFNDGNLNFQHTPIDDPCEVGGLVEDSGEVTPHDNNEFVIAQDYGSFDDGENLDSQYSSMLGESISGEFNLEVVGSKIDLPKVDTLANIDEDASKPSGPCQLGSKITFGEPSGEVFGLTFDNNCNGIFCNDGNNEFLPINTLQTDN